jgi:hypothetical protein
LNTKKLTSTLIASGLLFAVTSANATLTTYFGADSNPGFTVPVGGNAATARANFLGDLSGGVGNEDFESFAVGAGAPLNISFPGSSGNITATVNGTGVVGDNASGPGTPCGTLCGRFATSGSQFWESSSLFTIDFSTGISAFGFYATDIGDFNGEVTLTATASDGTATNFTIPNILSSANGSVLFYGFTDTANSYTSIAFGNTATGTDVFGFDDMVIGDLGQVVVPVPAAVWLFGSGLLGLVGIARRKKA